jgi:hypothetical protein
MVDLMVELVTSTCRLEIVLAIEVHIPTSTPPSTSVATPSKSIARRRRESKHRDNREHVTNIRSIDWKLADFFFEPLHARLDITLEGCADDEGLNSHGDLPQFLPSDSVTKTYLSGERVFFNPP